MKSAKKDLQKLTKKIREEWDSGEFPKAMMTGQQALKRTATINCGGEWRSANKSEKMAAAILARPDFVEFLKTWNAEACAEKVNSGAHSNGYKQVRIYFKGETEQ